MIVTEELVEWEDSRSMGRKREWFTIDTALAQLALHKPVQRHYLTQLKNSRNLSPATDQSTLIFTAGSHPSGLQQQQQQAQTTSTN